jgi:cytosine/adenosine deaminase-related metal-dependent hydrolase
MSEPSNRSDQPVAFRARWLIPVDQPPIEGGIVTIAGRRIVAVGENTTGKPPRDLGDVALLPGLVNAHTHLEFSLLERPLGQAGMAFPEWIARVVEHRRQQNKVLFVETDGFQRFRRRAAEAGVAESQTNGVTALGDVTTLGWPKEFFPAAGISATVFLELLGLDPSKEEVRLAMAQSFVLDLQDATSDVRPGLSPHSPYTVSPNLVKKVCQLSAAERFPVTMHLAESLPELELLSSHSGPLVTVLQRLNAWWPDAVPRGIRPLDYLETLATAHRALVIHGTFLNDSDWQVLAKHRDRMSVVYCPRTNAYFQHGRYPLVEMLAAGVRVAAGTDSRATNPDLRLFDELRHIARQHPDVAAETILNMGTLAGALALGVASRYGSITVGKAARLAVIAVSPADRDPIAALLHSNANVHALEVGKG